MFGLLANYLTSPCDTPLFIVHSINMGVYSPLQKSYAVNPIDSLTLTMVKALEL
jgi:hypothetical protein